MGDGACIARLCLLLEVVIGHSIDNSPMLGEKRTGEGKREEEATWGRVHTTVGERYKYFQLSSIPDPSTGLRKRRLEGQLRSQEAGMRPDSDTV